MRIGDVGVVTEHGSFDVFFNICLPADHPLHSTFGVPDGFTQVCLSDQDMESFVPGDRHGRVVAAQSISQRNLSIGAGVPASSFVSAQRGIGFEFTSASNEGAILVLPEGADRHDLRNHLVFEGEALRNGKSWYEFALRKLGRTMISLDSLYLITGCHQTSSWSLAAFHHPPGGSQFNAQFTAGPIINSNINAAYSWKMASAVPYRIGPQHYNATQRNQAVFIRGYKIAVRDNRFLGRLLGDVTMSYESPNTVSRRKKIYHPSDLLIECIMRSEPACEIFVIHDHVWSSVYDELPQGWDTTEYDPEIVRRIHEKYSVVSSNGTTYIISDKNFNYNWTEQDELMLIENALQERVETCGWVSNGLTCNIPVRGRDFSVHLRDSHGVIGTPASQHKCCWNGCRERDLNRDSLIRHLRERHLQWRWPCSYCRQDFTRKSTLIDHRARCGQMGLALGVPSQRLEVGDR